MTPSAREDVRAGLDQVLSDVPLRRGYVEATATATGATGITGRLEAGYRPLEDLALFGFGEVGTVLPPAAGVGAKWVF